MKITLLMAITLDGKIAQSSDHFPDWTGKADKKFFMEQTKAAGCLIMGSTTYDTIGRPLPGRKNVIMTRNSDKYKVVSGKYNVSELEFTSKSPAEIVSQLQSEGFEHAILGGGAQINSVWAEADLVDEIVLTISPLVFGEGISLFSAAVDLKLELQELTTLDDNLVCVRYKVVR